MPLISYIPKSFKPGFKELSKLNEETFNKIQDALSSALRSSSTIDLAANIAKLKDLDEETLEDIFTSIEGLISFLDEENQIEEITNDVVSILLSEKIILDKNKAEFKKRLLFLISDKKIYYASKASDLLTENKNTYIQSRILTDIRPVFDLDIENSPNAAVMLHTLHIHYEADGSAPHKDLYISLDSNDIASLIEVLIRAERKEESLKSLFKKAGIINLNE